MSLTVNAPIASPLMPTNMDGAIRLAEMMATMKLVPAHLQKSPGDCLMVIEQAMRWAMSPMAVAQATSVIQGRLMFEGKLVAAAVQSSGILADRLAYEFEGEGETRAVVVSATMNGESKPRTIRLTLKEAKTSNGMWVKQPDQQLVYAGTRVWSRRHAPEVMLGVYSPEEMEQPRQPYAGGPTIDAQPLRVNEHETARAINDAIPQLETPEALRNRADRLITVLAALPDNDAMKYERAEKNSRNLLADIAGLDDEAAREDLHTMVMDALAFARTRCVPHEAPAYAEADAS